MFNVDEKRLERIESKIDLIGSRLGGIEFTLGAQHSTLKEHARRSAALEAIVKLLERRVTMAEGAVALLGILSLIIGVYKILK